MTRAAKCPNPWATASTPWRWWSSTGPRFYAVKESELSDLVYDVDVLYPPEPATKEQLDVKKYGVIVSTKMKRGLLLPNLEGVDTIDFQLDIACQKAGIRSGEEYEIERFLVERHE